MSPAVQTAVQWCRQLRRSARTNHLLARLYAALQISFVLVAVAAVLHDAWHPGPHLRTVVLAALAAVAASTLLSALVRMRRDADLEQVAVKAEAAGRGFRSALITAVEMGLGRTPEPAGTPWILEALHRQIRTGITETDTSAVVETELRRGSSRVLLWTLAGLALAVASWPDNFRSGLRFFAPAPPATPAPAGPLRVASVVEDLDVRATPPAYTGLPARKLPGFSGTVTVLAGTELSIQGRVTHQDTAHLYASLPTRGGEEDRQTLRLEDGRFELRFSAMHDGLFHFEAERRGRLHVQQMPYRLLVSADEPPSARIVFPAQDQEVRLDDEVRVLFEAKDDFGVAAVRRVTRILGPGIERMRPVGLPEGRPTFSGRDGVVFRELGARPGDLVEVVYEAEDTNTLTGPRTARSAPRRFKIFSADERHARLLDREGELFEKMLTRLADRLELDTSTDGSEAAVRLHGRYLRIVSAEASYLAFFDALVRDLAEDALTTEIVRASFREMLARERGLHQRDAAAVRALKAQQAENPVLVRRATDLHPRLIDTFESDVLALDDLILQQRQDRLARDADELQRLDEQLRKLLASMREGATDAQMRQAHDTLDRLDERIRRMREEMGRMAKKLPYENFNPDALMRSSTQTSLSDVEERLRKIRELLAEGKTEEALRLAEELERDVQQLAAQMREGLVRPRTGGGGRLARRMQRAANKLGEMAEHQQRLHEETGRLEDKARRAMDERFRRGFDDEMEQARREVAEIKARLDSINPKALHEYDRGALDKLESGLDTLDQRLGNHDVPQAADDAAKLAEDADRLSMEMKLSARREKRHSRRRKMRRSAGVCQKAGGRLSQLAERLESMMPDPKEALGKRGMRKARELERRQVSLRHKLRETQGELQKVGEGYPAMKRLMKGMLEGAGTMMERAAKRLGEGQPKKAAPHQEDALERLRQAQKQIQDSLKHGGSPGGGGMEAVGPEPDHERIGIPGKEDFKAPRAFRDLLMRTMKERAPGQYEKALEQYYKELAK